MPPLSPWLRQYSISMQIHARVMTMERVALSTNGSGKVMTPCFFFDKIMIAKLSEQVRREKKWAELQF